MTLYLYQTWRDKRLRIRHRRLKKLGLTLSSEVMHKLWVSNAKWCAWPLKKASLNCNRPLA